MDKSVEKYQKRRLARLQARMDAGEDINWVTSDDGVHIPLDSDNNVVGGPLKGKKLSNAKSNRKASSGSEFSGESYDKLPVGFRVGGRKYASKEDIKQVKETVSKFMKEAKEGNEYEVGGGVGSGGGQTFKVVRSRGKLALAWKDKDGWYRRPVQMNRSNVESFLGNGAKRIK